MAFCKNCGTQIPDIAKFCPKCGMATSPASAKQPDQVVETVQPPAPPIQPLQQPAQQPVQPVQNVQPQQPPVQQPVQQPVQYAQPTQQPMQYTQPTPPPQQPKPPKKPVDFTWFNNHFILLFVIGGAIAFVLNELSAAYLAVSTAFAVVLAVFAILFACGFLAVAIVRIIASLKESKEERKKHSLRDNICIALGIIVFVFVLMSAVVVFYTVSEINAANDALSNIGSILGKM